MKILRESPRLAYAGAWILAGTYNFLRDVSYVDWKFLLLFNAVHFGFWALLGLLAMPLMRRYPLGRAYGPWLVHLVMGAAFVQADITLGHLVTYRLMGMHSELGIVAVAHQAFKNCFHLGMLTYWGFLGTVQLLDTQRKARQREREAADARHAALQAQLQSLRAQLQPHFLFNTLNGIAAVMHEDVAAADRMLNRLADLLRMTLVDGARAEVCLHQELAFVRAYLDIEKMRFGQRLAFDCQVPERLLQNPVPPFILQPLVENAIKYGISPHADGGIVAIRACERQGCLLLEVENGHAPPGADDAGFQIGLRNTRERLQALYGSSQHFELLNNAQRTVARIRLPLARQAA
jgi:hypothetical protein